MDAQRLCNTFFDLVKIDSPSRFEAPVAAYAQNVLESLGFEVTFDASQEHTGSNTGNLIAFLPGTMPGHLVFSAHMDCVEPCKGVEPCIEGEYIRSSGDTILGADDKAGVAAILEAMRSVLDSGMQRPALTVLFTTCEELSLLGAGGLSSETFKDNPPCFVFDADGAPGTVIIGAPYHTSFSASFQGKSAHAGVNPEEGTSAITMAAQAISSMKLGRWDEHTTANVGLIEGGREVNIVPDACIIKGECRSLYEEQLTICQEQVSQACEKAAHEGGGSVVLEWHLDYPGVLYDKEDPLIIFLIAAIQKAGLEPRFAFSGGGADTNIIASKNARAITLGIGMTNFHSVDEYIKVKDLEGSAQLAEALVKTFAEKGGMH